MKKYSTNYKIKNSSFSSHVFATSIKNAKKIIKKRNLKENINGIISDKEMEEIPSELFKNKEYLKCAHALCYLLHINNNKLIAYKAIKDNGILHEVIHLANDIEIWTHHSLDKIYNDISKENLKKSENSAYIKILTTYL